MLSVRQRNQHGCTLDRWKSRSTDLERTDEGLRRALSRWNALAIVVRAVIGAGIYLRPASVANLPPKTWSRAYPPGSNDSMFDYAINSGSAIIAHRS